MKNDVTSEQALEIALAQIEANFGKGPDTRERRKIRAQQRLRRLVPALEGARAEAAKGQRTDDCPDIAIDPFVAYAIGWSLRKEADTDEAIAQEGVSKALEAAADDIESGWVLGDAREVLADLEAEIEHATYVAEHGEHPPVKVPAARLPTSSGDVLPF